MKLIEDEVSVVEESLKQNEKAIQKQNKVLEKIRNEIDSKSTNQTSVTRSLQATTKSIEKLFNEKSIWIEKKEESTRKIRDVGWSISSSSFSVDDLLKLDLNSLLTNLKKCNEQLKSYHHINKKAGDQYISFIEQRIFSFFLHFFYFFLKIIILLFFFFF